MKIELREISVREICDGYKDSEEEGVFAFGGRLIMGTSVLLGFVCFPSLFLVVFNVLIFLNKSAFLLLEAKRGHFLF